MLDMMECAESTSVPSQSNTARRNAGLEIFGCEDFFVNYIFPIFGHQKVPKGFDFYLAVGEKELKPLLQSN